MHVEVSKSTALEQLNALKDAVEGLRDLNASSPGFLKWYEDVKGALKYVFGEESGEIRTFSRIRFSSPGSRLRHPKMRKAYQGGLRRTFALIASLIEQIEYYWDDDGGPTQPGNKGGRDGQADSKRVFVVHGRDQGALAEVKQVLSQLGLDPVVLQDMPNQGRTIIEKFEEYAQVGFAVVVCTPDDEGKPVAENTAPRPRVRQNVLLEWGYFLGELGRARVCALIKGEAEVPSDYSGVLYVEMDAGDDWKLRLADELSQARYDIDANDLLSGRSVVAT